MANWFEWGLALYLSNLILSNLILSYLISLRKLYRDNLGVQAKFSESQHDSLDSFAKVGIGPWADGCCHGHGLPRIWGESWIRRWNRRGCSADGIDWIYWNYCIVEEKKHSKFNVSSISSVMFLALHEPLFSNPIRDDYVRMTAVLGWFETTSQILSVECGWQLIEMKHYHSATCSQPGYEVGHGLCPFNLISQPHSTENLFGRS